MATTGMRTARDNALQGGQSLRGPVGALGRRVVDRPERQPVGAGALSLDRFLKCVDRSPNENVVLDDGLDVADRQRGGGSLHSACSDREGHVHPIVDREKASSRRDSGEDAPAELGEVVGAEILLADLDGGEPRRHARGHHLDQVAAPRLPAVGDEDELQLVQSGMPSSGDDAVA